MFSRIQTLKIIPKNIPNINNTLYYCLIGVVLPIGTLFLKQPHNNLCPVDISMDFCVSFLLM